MTEKETARKDLLSWCLWLPDQIIPRAMKRVRPEDLPDPDDRAIYQSIIDLHTRGEVVDLVTLSIELAGKMENRVDKLVALVDRPVIAAENLFGKFLEGICNEIANRKEHENGRKDQDTEA